MKDTSTMDWLGPTLGLLGVSIATSLAFYQWRKSNEASQRVNFETARARALEQIIDELRSVQILSRRGTITSGDLDGQIRAINEHLITNDTVLTAADKVHARQYIDSLAEVHRAIQEAPAEDVMTWGVTAANFIDPAVIKLLALLDEANEYFNHEIRESWRKGRAKE